MTVLLPRSELQAALDSGRVLQWFTDSGTGATFYCDLADGRVFKGPAHDNFPAFADAPVARNALAGNLPDWIVATAVPSVQIWKALDAPAVPVYLHAGRIVVGPFLSDGVTHGGCYWCVVVRMLASSPHGHVLGSAWRRTFPVGEWVVDHLTHRFERLLELSAFVRNAPGSAASIALTDGRERTHRVTNLPGHPHHAATVLTDAAGLS